MARKNSPITAPPAAFPRKSSPSTPQNANFGPFFVRRANFVALTPTIRPSRANFFAHEARQRGDIETNNTTAHLQQGTAETGITTAAEKRTKKHPFLTCKGDGGFKPTQTRTSKGDMGFRQPSRLVDRAWPRGPWGAVGPVRGTRGQYPLQTSSNRSNLKPLVRTHVTNVVNLRPKTAIFSEKAVGLTTFVTTDQKSRRKTPPIDDVCNNTQRSAPKSQHDEPDHIGGPEGTGGFEARRRRDWWAWLRRPWAVAGPGRASTATRHHWCGGRRRDRRARAGFEARRRTK